MEKPLLYTPEKEARRLSLTEEQKNTVRAITFGIEEVDETVREMAAEDVIKTLENGHPLNRIIPGDEDKISGYIACEDFVPKEAYIKYFGTTKETGRNLLKEIPAFLEYAKKNGYSKLSFHGWNNRLNNILQRYGFERIRTDNMADFTVDFYEKNLIDGKTEEQINEERQKAFEQKYINRINQEYTKTLATFSAETKNEKERSINEAFQSLGKRLSGQERFVFSDRQQAVLKLKLARHFQTNDTIDQNTLFDAIIESPKFINTDKGSLHRLFEVHEEKTLQKIAEIRKQRAEMTGGESFNPYEALFETKSGKYYMARLLNMPHLEKESEYMNHCVGTSDSYINKMKRGEVEILSFRNTPKVNQKTQKLEGDTPIMTIEYNRKTKVIEQMKKYNDSYLSSKDEYFQDVVDALKQLRSTETDTGELRNFKKISNSELENFSVKDYHLLTENGEISLKNFNPSENTFVLKIGKMEIGNKTSKEDASKIMKIVSGIDCTPDQIAYAIKEINKNTKAYIGEWNPEIAKKIPDSVEHLYESFPKNKILRTNIELSTKTGEEYKKTIESDGMLVSSYAESVLNKMEKLKSNEKVDLVSFSVAQLGFEGNATTDQIYAKAEELGLELCPPQVGPELRLTYKDQPYNDYLRIAMKQITDSGGYPHVFGLDRDGGGLWLDDSWAKPDGEWYPGRKFVFRIRKSES